jgi:hypothetical protein
VKLKSTVRLKVDIDPYSFMLRPYGGRA